MADPGHLKTFVNSQLQYNEAVGRVDQDILAGYADDLHKLWSKLTDDERKAALSAMLRHPEPPAVGQRTL